MTRKLLARSAVAAAILVALLAVLLLLPPPTTVLRAGLLASSDWILADYIQSDGVFGKVKGVGKKFVATYLQYGLLSRLDNGALPASDVDRIVNVLRGVRRIVLNSVQVRHVPRGWPVLISGFGFCDQDNAVASQMLARSFPRSEIYALWDPVRRISPHTIGRVWSNQYRDWLYCDVFFDEIVVFRQTAAGPRFLARVSDPGSLPFRGSPAAGTYELGGWTQNEYRPTFAGYLAWKVTQAVTHRTTASIVPVPVPAAEAGAEVPKPPENNDVFRRVRHQYVAARVEHLLGDEATAAAAYGLVAADAETPADWRAAELAKAARIFSAGLSVSDHGTPYGTN